MTDIFELEQQLVAAQAREKVLRDALKMQPRNLRTVWKDGIDLDLPDRITERRDEALAMPVNDTALRGLLEHENSVWYSALGPNYVDFDPVGAVRAFEAQVKLEAMCEMERYHDTTLKAALANERERCCSEIKAADDKASEEDYMLDSNDCISVIRGTWKGGE